MNTFIKTFFVCLIMAFGFMAYKFVSGDSYSLDLKVSNQNPIFGIHEEFNEPQEVSQPINKPSSDFQNAAEKNKKYKHKCYFYSNFGELVVVDRDLSFKPTLENALTILLKGPTISETKKGLYSEIPANVDLISVRRIDNSVIVDLSSNFGNGGGSNSINNRIKQLSKTVKLYEPNKNIYLYINGKEIEYLGGDGVYVKQPLD